MKHMKTDYRNMSITGLEELLKKTQSKLEDKEDEKDLLEGQSQSGQHMSSEYFQSNYNRLEQDIKSLNSAVGEIKAAIESKKGSQASPAA